MHKIVFILLIFIFITTSYLAVDIVFSPNKINGDEADSLILENISPENSLFSELKEPLYFAPTKIILGNTFINVEEIGLENDGQLQVPSTWSLAGWYKNSAKVGEKGNIIIDGHYDTDTAAPAAFWGLKNLKVNDTVTLQDELRREFSYSIIDTLYVDISDPQRTKIFDDTEEAELTLITCGGVWDSAAGTYNKRLVVKAKLL